MKNNAIYKYKTYCELVIVTDGISPEEITRETQIKPYRQFIKGEIFRAKTSGSEGKRANNLWAIKSDTIISEVEDISAHIQYFRNIFKNKVGVFQKLKTDEKNKLNFWIWIEVDEVGVGFDLSESDLIFINEISNMLHVSIVPLSK